MNKPTTKFPREIVRGDIITTALGTWIATGAPVCCGDIAEIPVTGRDGTPSTPELPSTLAVDLHTPLSISRAPRQELIASLRQLADDLEAASLTQTEGQVFS
jgi:hypothetical protein